MNVTGQDLSQTSGFSHLSDFPYSQPSTGEGTLCPYYRVHPGRNRFCFKGHCVMSRQLGLFYLTLFLLVGISGVFLAFDARYLATTLSPLVPVFGALLFLFTFSVLLRTSFSDPGILPRASRFEVKCLEEDTLGSGVPLHQRSAMPSREINIRDFPYTQVYCYTCRIYRPPRTSHCSICDNCIERFDHHCPWVGNCVGARNYRYFVIFLLAVSLLCFYVLCFSVVNVAIFYQNSQDIIETVKQTPASFVVILFTFFLCLSISGLSFYHVYLSCREISTHEDIRLFPKTLRQMGRKNPFCKGNGCANMLNVLCGPVPPSRLKAWKLVDPETVRPSHGSELVSSPLPAPDKQSVISRPLRFDAENQRNENWRSKSGGYPQQFSSPSVDNATSANNGTPEPQPHLSTSRPKTSSKRRVMLADEIDEHGDKTPSTGFVGRAIVSAMTTPQAVHQGVKNADDKT